MNEPSARIDHDETFAASCRLKHGVVQSRRVVQCMPDGNDFSVFVMGAVCNCEPTGVISVNAGGARKVLRPIGVLIRNRLPLGWFHIMPPEVRNAFANRLVTSTFGSTAGTFTNCKVCYMMGGVAPRWARSSNNAIHIALLEPVVHELTIEQWIGRRSASFGRAN